MKEPEPTRSGFQLRLQSRHSAYITGPANLDTPCAGGPRDQALKDQRDKCSRIVESIILYFRLCAALQGRRSSLAELVGSYGSSSDSSFPGERDQCEDCVAQGHVARKAVASVLKRGTDHRSIPAALHAIKRPCLARRGCRHYDSMRLLEIMCDVRAGDAVSSCVNRTACGKDRGHSLDDQRVCMDACQPLQQPCIDHGKKPQNLQGLVKMAHWRPGSHGPGRSCMPAPSCRRFLRGRQGPRETA